MIFDVWPDEGPNLVLNQKVKEDKSRYFLKITKYFVLFLRFFLGYSLLKGCELKLLLFDNLHANFFHGDGFTAKRLPLELIPLLLFINLFDHIVYLFLVFLTNLHFRPLCVEIILVKCL